MELVQKIMEWVPFVAQLFMGLSILATVVVRVIPGEKDDAAVGKVVGFILKALAWLPTIGVNPQTKKLEDALKELKK
jgi:Trk-type K+ transport system membrane component